MKSLSAFQKNPAVRFKDQAEKEVVLLLLRRHPITNLWWIFVAIGLSLLPPLFILFNPLARLLDLSFLPPAHLVLALIVWYLFVFGFILQRFIDWFFNVSLITSERLVDIDYLNLLFFKVSETDYPKVQDVTYDVSGFLATFANFGDLYVQTAGTQENFVMNKIPNPAGVHDLITDLMDKFKSNL